MRTQEKVFWVACLAVLLATAAAAAIANSSSPPKAYCGDGEVAVRGVYSDVVCISGHAAR